MYLHVHVYLLGVYFQVLVLEVVVCNAIFELHVHGVVFGNLVLHALLPLAVLSAFVVLAGLLAKVD